MILKKILKFEAKLSLLILLVSMVSVAPSYAANKNTITLISSNLPTAELNQSVTISATVSPTSGRSNPTGTVTFNANGSQIGSCPLTTNSCGITHIWTALGEYSIVAIYTPTGNFNTSSSTAINQIITVRATTTVVTSNHPTATIGEALTFTTVVTSTSGNGPIPTGSVILHAYLDDTVIGECTLDASGSCTIQKAASTVGNHRVWAAYSGNSTDYKPSNSAYIYQNNLAKPSSNVLASSAPSSPTDFGVAITFTATVSSSNGVPTGVITFNEGANIISSCVLDGTGSCSAIVNNLQVGTHTIKALFSEDAHYQAGEATFTHVVNAVAVNTSTTLVTSANPGISGRDITLTATVASSAGIPTGDVKFFNGATEIGLCTLNSSGICSISTNSLPIGTLTLNANYLGASLFNSSDNSLTQVILESSSRLTTTVLTAADTVIVGESLNLTATVTDAVLVTGNVIFKDGTTENGTCTLNAGSCQINIIPNTVGIHAYSASYLGNVDLDQSIGFKSITVQKRSANLTVTASSNPAARLTLVTFSVSLEDTSTGPITVLDGTTPLQGCTTLISGKCNISLYFSTQGAHNLTFNYLGDSLHNSDTFEYTMAIGIALPTLAVTSDKSSAEFSEDIVFTGTLSNTAATGTILFKVDDVGISSCTVASGVCSITYASFDIGVRIITAIYSGDSNNAGATSPDFSQLVTLSSTTTTIASTENPFEYGSGLVLTATVVNQGTGPTGNVQFEDVTTSPSVALGHCTLIGRTCFITLDNPLSIGTHKISAEYTSDGNYAGSRSSEIIQVITAPTSAVAVITSKSVVNVGESITFTVNVAPDGNTATGTIQLKDGSNNLRGLLTLSDGSATYTTSSLAVGTHSITAEYSGDSNHLAHTSNVLIQKVLIPVTISLSANPVSLIYTNQTRLTATFTSNSGTPTGVAIFEEELPGGDVIIGSCTLSNGTCSIANGTLGIGTHTLIVEYGGLDNFASGESNLVTVTITPRPIVANPVPTPEPISNPNPNPTPNPTPKPTADPSPKPATVSTTLSKAVPLVVAISPNSETKIDFNAKRSDGSFDRINITVPAGAVDVPATLEISQSVAERANSKGFVAFDLHFLTSGNTYIYMLNKQITIRMAQQNHLTPSVSDIGLKWEAIAKVVNGTLLTKTNHDGYFVGKDKSLNILTLHPAVIDFLEPQNHLFIATTANRLEVETSIQLGHRGGSGEGDIEFGTTTSDICMVSVTGSVYGKKVGVCKITLVKHSDDNYFEEIAKPKIIYIKP